ncbi:hypothetical protein ILUMI_12635 [Ignelater luminosus]|uniref:Uncharacterized protein n=1 Tax=Ignelater luminosus TaxID=2038154 RepID=A0A8K0CZ76_IGNLU|nr:hypothetical protein ILUMI_12635 [Ignelater luminosus]
MCEEAKVDRFGVLTTLQHSINFQLKCPVKKLNPNLNVHLCIQEFMDRFPNRDFYYDNLSKHVRRVFDRFRRTGIFAKSTSSGRTIVLPEDVEDVRTRMEQTPKKSLRQLSQQNQEV